MKDHRQFGPSQVGKIFGVSRATASRWMNRGKLKSDKLPSKHKRCTLDHLQQFVQDTGNQYFEVRLTEYIEALDASPPSDHNN